MTASPDRQTIRVFQVATGNVGSEMIRRISAHPDLELVGLHCYTPEKIGRDAGELAGHAPVGAKATGSVDEPSLAARKGGRRNGEAAALPLWGNDQR